MSKFSSDIFSCISDSFLNIVGFPLLCEVFSNLNTFETLVYPVVQGMRHQCYNAYHLQTSFSTGDNLSPFHSLRDSLTPADVRLRPLLGAFRTFGAVPSGLFSHPRLQMSQKFRPRHPTEPKFLRHLEIGFAHIEEAANKLNSFVSANVAQIKRLQVVNFVVFCVVLANFLRNPCHNIILKAPDHTRSRPRDGNAAACAQ